MAKPERGGASEEQTLSPEQRIQEAARRKEEREEEAREIGKNLGIAINIAAEVEALTQFAEKDPSSSEAKEIKGAFFDYEGTLGRIKEKEEWIKELNKVIALTKEIAEEEGKSAPDFERVDSLMFKRAEEKAYKFFEGWAGEEWRRATGEEKIRAFKRARESTYKELEGWQQERVKEEEKIRDLAKRILPPH